ncbi:type II secretion system F family protein [Paenibacillus sp. MZ04-78.2]|uniref:type II secretion system F family protein n=1 Tax=Paenibacillus sp. MZ04-78.2 TaxID=2962034 RepID=UPI0020B76005|nr:type II secretion system F family protein [Paenibacillus sp. MZ04-78.2]MCP3775677.1 type II secretion system F family protein [Paenibacillus sp. MZ04-78.2]
MLALLLLELFAVAGAARAGFPKYAPWVRDNRGLTRSDAFYWLAPASLWFMDRTKLADRLSEPLGKVHRVMIGLYGAKSAISETKWFAAKTLIIVYGLVILTTMAGLAAGEAEMLVYGLPLTIFVPFLMYKQAAGDLKRKKQSILIELPEVLNQLMLLVGAGETVPQALIRITNGKEAVASPLMVELKETVHALKVNVSFPKAMEDFSKRCAVQEVSLFTTTLLLNYKRGGDELVMALKELSANLWEKRKALAKTLGEEAASKLVFPMVMIFFVVMVMVAAPALMMVN